jgi:hypothetical protein
MNDLESGRSCARGPGADRATSCLTILPASSMGDPQPPEPFVLTNV